MLRRTSFALAPIRSLALALAVASLGRAAELRLAAPYQSGMVLQRGAPVVVRGTASPGAVVRVQFDSEVAEGEAGPDGAWRVAFAPRPASVLARSIVVEGDGGRRVLDDVLVGEVWLLVGSQDLAAPLGRPTDGALALPQHLRFFVPAAAAQPVDTVWSAAERRAVASNFFTGVWARAAEVDPAALSAVAWHFGLALESAQHAPIGIVQLATVPATLESWLPRQRLQSDDRLGARLVDWWRTEAVPAELRVRARRNLAGHFDGAATAPDAGVHPFQPGFLWDAVATAFRGPAYAGVVLGCDAEHLEDPELHTHLLRTSVEVWRELVTGARPVVLVQSHGSDLVGDVHGPRSALRRDAERRLAHGAGALPQVGLVVTQDLPTSGSGLERRRRVIGERLAWWALDLVHDRVGLVPSGPLPLRFTSDPKARTTRVVFEHNVGLTASDGLPLRGFAVVGADGREVRADARVADGALVLTHPDVVTPREVRYGFDPAVVGNLVNGAGLPAPTFRLQSEAVRAIEASAERRARGERG